MKLIFIGGLILLLSGCATGGAFMRGFAQGYNAGNETAQPMPIQQTVNCTSYAFGNSLQTHCY